MECGTGGNRFAEGGTLEISVNTPADTAKVLMLCGADVRFRPKADIQRGAKAKYSEPEALTKM
jgi:hypothetical protein